MILLGVNIDHAATLRQARYRQHSATVGGAVEPDPVALALIAERAGLVVTDRRGGHIAFNSPSAQSDGVLALPPALHSDALWRLTAD